VQLASARNSLVGFPWWSPTGSHAIYLSDPCCPFDIYRVAADGSGKTLLVPNGDALGWVAED
jgi:Tol biopolymer transport system component